jgi:hypothetical protein
VAEDVKPATVAPAEVAEKLTPAAAAPASVSVTPVVVGESATVAADTSVAPVPTAAPPENSDTPIIEQLRSTPKAKNNRDADENAASSYRSVNTKLDSEREALRAEVRELARQLERAQRQLAELDMAATQGLKKQGTGNWKPDPRVKAAAPSSPEAGYEKFPAGTFMPRAGGGASFGGVGVKPPDSNASRERRLAEVEANLQALLDEVRALRKEAPEPTPRSMQPR